MSKTTLAGEYEASLNVINNQRQWNSNNNNFNQLDIILEETGNDWISSANVQAVTISQGVTKIESNGSK